jgi:hypothetical protein
MNNDTGIGCFLILFALPILILIALAKAKEDKRETDKIIKDINSSNLKEDYNKGYELLEYKISLKQKFSINFKYELNSIKKSTNLIRPTYLLFAKNNNTFYLKMYPTIENWICLDDIKIIQFEKELNVVNNDSDYKLIIKTKTLEVFTLYTSEKIARETSVFFDDNENILSFKDKLHKSIVLSIEQAETTVEFLTIIY